MIAIIVILSLILIIIIGVVAFEASGPVIDFFQRRGIGSLENEEWFEKASSVAESWIEKGLPQVPVRADNQLTLPDRIKGTYSSPTIHSWQTGSVMLGLEASGLGEYCSSGEYIDENTGEWKINPDRVDYSMLAYAILSGSLTDSDFVKPAMDSMAEFLLDKFNKFSSIPYSDNVNHRYVDTIGMVCPFLMKYSVVYNKPEAMKAAVSLIEEFALFGVHKESGLPVHCFDAESKIPLGIYGWGRGCGWWATGLATCFEILKTREGFIEEKTVLVKNMLSLAQKLSKYQNPDGSFGMNLSVPGGADSSATAMISYFMAYTGQLCKKESFVDCARKGMKYIYSVTRKNGIVDYSQGDTMGIGFYSRSSIVLPATQGFALRAYTLLKK